MTNSTYKNKRNTVFDLFTGLETLIELRIFLTESSSEVMKERILALISTGRRRPTFWRTFDLGDYAVDHGVDESPRPAFSLHRRDD
jgi:hypothetical protein